MPGPEDAVAFYILGPFEASRGDEPLEVGAGKQRALLVLLLLHAGEFVTTDTLIDALWGESPPASALNSVHIYVSHLRKALGNGRLETRGRGYLLAVEPEQLDLGRFERLLGEGRDLLGSGDAERAAAVLTEALGLWRGPPLSDVALEPFAQSEIARLSELRVAALEERIDADLVRGRHAELVPELDGLVRAHPLRERIRAQLMLALYRSGREPEALETYREARRLLATELGLEPGRRLRELEAAILRQDAQLDPPSQRRTASRPTRRPRRLFVALVATALVAAAIVLAGFRVAGGDAPPEVLPNSLVRIDSETLKPTNVMHLGDAPDLVVLADGFAWVTHHVLRDTDNAGLRNAGDRTLTRVDLSTGEPKVVGGGLAPCGIVPDPSGDVWVANCYAPGSGSRDNVVRLDARTLDFEAGPWPVPPAADFYRGLAYGGGSLWLSAVARPSDARKTEAIARIDPRTGEWRTIPLRWPPRPLAWSEGYGELWLSNFQAGSVSRLDTATDVPQTTFAVAANPGALAVDGDTVWVADWSSPNVARLHAVGRTRPRSISLPVKNLAEAGVSYLAAGAGAVWAVTPHDRTLWRIDPKTEAVTPIALAHDPWGVAANDDGVWVTVRAE